MGGYTICPKTGLKKGVWSVEEDRLLTDYITRYGHWNWRELPKYAGLSRCGKSCRLRWMNYLRPNIKRGNFTREEEELIVNLHERLGNRWSVIAASLPGRTDNEIKNHWHTHLKKKTERRDKGANQKVRKCKSLAELIMPDFVHSNNVAHLVYENSDAILINVTPTTTEIEERQESQGSELSQWWDGWTQQTDMDILDCYQPSHDAKSSGFSSFICDSCESTGIKGESEISISDNVGDLLNEPFFAENSLKPDENTSVIAEPSHQFVVPPLDDMCTAYDLDMFFN